MNCRLHVPADGSDAGQLFSVVVNGDTTLPSDNVTALPVPLVSTTPYTGEVVPSVTVPKLCCAVDNVTPPAATPVPANVIPETGVPPEVIPVGADDKVNVWLNAPAAVGLNSNCRLQLAPATSVAGQLFSTIENGALTVPCVNVTSLAEEFVSTAPYTAEVLPSSSDPKLCPAELSDTAALDTPVPLSVPPLLGPKVIPDVVPRLHVADNGPVASGAKMKTISHLPPAAMLAGQLFFSVNADDPEMPIENAYAVVRLLVSCTP